VISYGYPLGHSKKKSAKKIIAIFCGRMIKKEQVEPERHTSSERFLEYCGRTKKLLINKNLLHFVGTFDTNM